MIERQISNTEFTDVMYGGDAYMSVGINDAFGGLVYSLLTGRYTGDIQVYLNSDELKQLLNALDNATLIAQATDRSIEQKEIATMRFAHEGSKIENVISVYVQQQLVLLDLAWRVTMKTKHRSSCLSMNLNG